MAQHGRPIVARGRDSQLCEDGEAAAGVGGAHSTVRTGGTTQPVGREGALVRGASQRGKGWEIGVSLATPPKLRRLQEALYTKAKQDGDTRSRRAGRGAFPRTMSSGSWGYSGSGVFILGHLCMLGCETRPRAGCGKTARPV